MAAPPRKFVPSFQFSLRFLLHATTLIALFYGLRRGYLMSAFHLNEVIERARNVPTILALAAALLAVLLPLGSRSKPWFPANSGIILGAAVGSLSCLALVIEFGESLRRMDYWNWWRDWPFVAPYLIVATVQGGAIGAFVTRLGGLLRYAFLKRRIKTNLRSHTAKCTTGH